MRLGSAAAFVLLLASACLAEPIGPMPDPAAPSKAPNALMEFDRLPEEALMPLNLGFPFVPASPMFFTTNQVFIAPAAAGANDGLACASAKAYAYFNSSGNWSATPTGIQIGPGTTVGQCSGNYTVELQFQGDGATNNPVVLQFQAGATMNVPAQPNNGAIYGGASRSWVEVDGNGVGVISSTDNGSVGSFGNQVDAGGIYFPICNHCRIHGFNGTGGIGPMYQHVSPADNNSFGDSIDIHGGSNNRIDDNIIFDSANCITYTLTGTVANVEIDHDVEFNCNWGVVSGANGDVTVTNFWVHHNDWSNWQKWDTTANTCCHHNGFHQFLQGGTGASTINGSYFYSNYCHGDAGVNSTACWFIETGSGANISPTGFNNVYWMTTHAFANGAVNSKGAGNTGTTLYSNLFGYPVNLGGNCVLIQASTGMVLKDNLFVNCGQVLCICSTGTLASSDFNLFFGTTNFGPGSSSNPTFAAWKSATGGDANSVTTDPLLDSSFVPQTGSGAINLGTNLFSVGNGQPIPGLGALTTDKNGATRPSSGNWTGGPINASSTPSPSPAPCINCVF